MFYHRLGKIPKKRHTTFYKENGELYREQLMGLRGFFGLSSLLYKESLPPATEGLALIAKPQALIDLAEPITNDLSYYHFTSAKISHVPPNSDKSFLYLKRTPLLKNSHMQIGITLETGKDPGLLLRNGSHHELHYVDRGQGELKSEFGVLPFADGDYILIPRGIAHQWHYQRETKTFLVQSTAPITFPKSYFNDHGQFLEHSPICERDIRPPSHLEAPTGKGPFTIYTHRDGNYFENIVQHHPFDTVGWDGHLYPLAISIHDFEPIVGSLHQPPYVHAIFQSEQFVVCNFVPRLFDFHKNAIPAPYFHQNVESDEIIFYSRGNFMSRSGIEQGSLSYHPGALPHGPQPGRTEASIGKKETDELAVMVDTFSTIYPTAFAKKIADPKYPHSWISK